jgi:hypothetical protein
MADMTTTQAMAHCPTSAAKTTFLTAADTFLTALDTMKTAADSGNAGVWTAAIAGSPTGGTYTLTLTGASRIAAQTVTLAFNAPAADVQTAIRALVGENLSQTTVTATGTTPNFTHTITFKGVREEITVTRSIAGLTGGSPALTLTNTVAYAALPELSTQSVLMFKNRFTDLLELLGSDMRA